MCAKSYGSICRHRKLEHERTRAIDFRNSSAHPPTLVLDRGVASYLFAPLQTKHRLASHLLEFSVQ